MVLDTRPTAEFRGADIRAAYGGAVPGTVHQDRVEHLTPDGTMLPGGVLRSQFEALGHSVHAYLAFRLLGYPRIRNYPGSWKGWGNRTELPVEIPKEAGS